jgi:hypothetical protein
MYSENMSIDMAILASTVLAYFAYHFFCFLKQKI